MADTAEITQKLRAALIKGGPDWAAAAPGLAQNPEALWHGAYEDADLRGRDLSGLDLSHGDFFRARLDKANLKKTCLAKADLTHAQLKHTAFYKADLRGAILQEANLSGSDLGETDCRDVDFRGADLTGCQFVSADLRGCDFSHCDLTGANLTGANVTGAIFHFTRMDGANITHMKYGGFRDLAGHFYGIRGVEATYGNALFVRDAKDQDYIDTLYQSILHRPRGVIRTLDLLLFRAWGSIDHGRSLAKVSAYAFVIATLYGFIYLMDMTYDWQIMDYSSSAKTWFTPFYYSVVTYTTLGFGDVTADSLMGEILVISEVIVGYFTLGLLLAILANTIARRS